MDSTQQLHNIYKLYSEKKYSEAFLLVQEILKIEPQNVYAKRYVDLLKPYLNDKSEVGKIATIKGKNLRCPHCTSAISLSALTEDQKTKIRNNNYENLSIKCPYCHTQFTLQKKTSESIIGIKIGDTINYNNKKYRVVGSVNYEGKWFEDIYSDSMSYLEWILLGEDNSYLYFSEGYFWDDGDKKYEFEFSEKIIPNFSVKFEGKESIVNGKKRSYIAADGIYREISEKNIVFATKLYGENSKVFRVGEKIELLEFTHNQKKYVLEKESAGRQSEAGIYKTELVSPKEAFKIFGKEYKFVNFVQFDDRNTYGGLVIGASLISMISLMVIGGKVAILGPLLFLFILGAALMVRSISHNHGPYANVLYIMLSVLFLGPLLAYMAFYISANFINPPKKEIPIEKIYSGEKFEVYFSDNLLRTRQEIKTQKYDYGGVSTTYKERDGLKFSVKTEKDREILKKITYGEGAELKTIFKEKIYQLR